MRPRGSIGGRRGFGAACCVAILLLAGCTNADNDAGGKDERSPEPAEDRLEAPTKLRAELDATGSKPLMTVTFSEVDGAEKYWVDRGKGKGSLEVRREDCEKGRCEMRMNKLAAKGASQVTVIAAAGKKRSKPSQALKLPDWPTRPPGIPDRKPGDPYVLTIHRKGPDGKPRVDTEKVAADKVEERMAELRAQPDVIAVSKYGDWPLVPLLSAPKRSGAWRSGTWQTDAFDFDAFPGDPRTRGKGIKVAVLDSGADIEHESLRNADVRQVNLPEPGRSAPDTHGTAMASLLVGQGDGEIPGVVPGATLLHYDVHNVGGKVGGERASLGRGVYRAVDDGAKVISISQTGVCRTNGDCGDQEMRAAVDYAESKGVLVVGAAGNDGSSSPECEMAAYEPNVDQTPAIIPSVLTVGGTTRDGSRWTCSPKKDYVDVLAPAADMYFAEPDGYFNASGTSASAPLVAGFAAVLLEQKPDLTPAKIRRVLARSTAENGRLIPAVALAQLNIGDGQVIDPVSDERVVPFSLRIDLDEKHPSWPVLRPLLTEEQGYGTPPKKPPFLSRVANTDIQIEGLMRITEGGRVKGKARMRPAGVGEWRGNWWGQALRDEKPKEERIPGTIIECPHNWTKQEFPPIYSFDWRIPASYSASVLEEEGKQRVRLSVSLGNGATPSRPGKVGQPYVIEDQLAECKELIAKEKARVKKEDTLDIAKLVNPDFHTWEHVKQRKAKWIPELRRYYQTIADSGPFTITSELFELEDLPYARSTEGSGPGYTSRLTLGRFGHYYTEGG